MKEVSLGAVALGMGVIGALLFALNRVVPTHGGELQFALLGLGFVLGMVAFGLSIAAVAVNRGRLLGAISLVVLLIAGFLLR